MPLSPSSPCSVLSPGGDSPLYELTQARLDTANRENAELRKALAASRRREAELERRLRVRVVSTPDMLRAVVRLQAGVRQMRYRQLQRVAAQDAARRAAQ